MKEVGRSRYVEDCRLVDKRPKLLDKVLKLLDKQAKLVDKQPKLLDSIRLMPLQV
jgi:aryl carrier-like protein